MAVSRGIELVEHVGHDIECVTYGDPAENVTLECLTCGEILVDFDLPRPRSRRKKGERKTFQITLMNGERKLYQAVDQDEAIAQHGGAYKDVKEIRR